MDAWSNLKVAKLFLLLNEKYSSQIEHQYLIRSLHDKQFEFAYKFFLGQLILFVVTFCLPLTLFFLRKNDEMKNQLYIYLSMSGGSIFTLYELIKIKSEGLREYFSQFWNQYDVVGLTIYWTHVGFCLSSLKQDDFDSEPQIYLRTAIILYMVLKISFFIRIFRAYGLFVSLIVTCLHDIIPFISFLIMWIFCFYLFYVQSGIKSPEKTELGSYTNIQDFFFIWFNSTKGAKYWSKTTDISNPYIFYLMAFIWFSNQFFIATILLSFLVAVVMQSYRSVMECKDVKKYGYIAAFNYEAFLMLFPNLL